MLRRYFAPGDVEVEFLYLALAGLRFGAWCPESEVRSALQHPL